MNRNEPNRADEPPQTNPDNQNGSLSARTGEYVDTLYDFALRASLDPAIAAASVLAALERASAESSGERQASLVASILGIARDEVLERSRNRGAGNGDEAPALQLGDPRFYRQDGEDADEELALWAWQA